MLELEAVSISFDGRAVLRDCSLHAAAGERLALMGPSGCGKTTLLLTALGLVKPDAGTVRRAAARVGAVFQEPRLLPWQSAAGNVNAVLSDGPGTLPEARQWLTRLELGDAAELYPRELSGGMRQRVAIARALAYRPELLVLDEPFRGLDGELSRRVSELISRETEKTALLLATHSEAEAAALGCRILRFREGRFV